MLATQGRLRSLLKANQAVVEHLELPVVLRRIVEAAVELVGARYGALGVVAADGTLEQLVHVGMTDDEMTAIGRLPSGHGLLGALIDDPRPIRLDNRSEDPRSVGLPAGHPPMDSFLGVPIRVRDEVFGNLYLSNHPGGSFTEEDEQLVTALAATAGVAIENARLFAEIRRRQAWSSASAEINETLVSSDEANSISTLAARVLRLAEADVVWVLLPTDDPKQYRVETARGLDHLAVEGSRIRIAGSVVARVLEDHHPRLIDDGSTHEVGLSTGDAIGPAMAVPLMAGGHPQGILYVARTTGRARFAASDLEMAADFAGQASLAVELTAARVDRQRMVLLEERGRIARDLHDHVIQQLFATGLDLQNVAESIAPSSVSDHITHSVSNLDAAISQIRTVIYALTPPDHDRHDTIRNRIIELAGKLSPGLARTPSVTFFGPVDLVITADLADDVIAVAREALSNVIKHADAQNTSVSLSVSEGSVSLEISDDGCGSRGVLRRSGVANLEQRALRRGGAFTFDSDATGTRLRWSVPFAPDDSLGA
ncbi:MULTISPECIES: GAF domain-containing protein [unclassified Microbacterium]|uniref:sensor histidine kinase n=1 Tax=unclassified Microbacterium TaxID=2609290 RepID=UPI00217E5A78|nr:MULTISPECIES: GAF domain-containing protein [unclassified Microbacterium]